MPQTTRRRFLGGCVAALAAGACNPAVAADQTGGPIELPLVGKVRPRSALEITASPLSVGFETLDRRMFEPERTYPHLARLGVKWARVQTGWARTETARGRYDFAWLDSVVDSLRRIGVQPWFNLGYGNQLYTPDAPDASAVGWAPVFDQAAEQAWLEYTRAIAQHFSDRVKHWEIWNEPNIRNFWKPRDPSAQDYVRLVAATAPEIRRRVPEAVIIGGALAGMPTKYLEECLSAGIAELVDRISYHPYRPVPETDYEPTIAAWRELLDKHKPELQLWQGENGCPSQPGGAGALRDLAWDETRQAKWLLRRILSDLRLGVELTSYFHLVDLVNYNWGSGSSGVTNYKGLLRGTDYTPKPSYFAYQNLCALFDANTRLTQPCSEVLDTGLDKQRVRYLRQGHFIRRDARIVAYWYPGKLLEDWPPTRLSIKVATAPDTRLTDPVLVDPLTSQVRQLKSTERSETTVVFDRLPLLDYPLLIADRSAVDLL